jgi:ribosomal protein S18 acetylase RimI-like enzyme
MKEIVSAANPESSSIAIRSAEPADAVFFEKLYVLSRRDEFAILGWNDEQLEAFLKMQFDIQTRGYQTQFPEAQNFVIETEGEPAGRLITTDEILLVDIAVRPDLRGRGIGTAVLKHLQAEAAARSKPIFLQVLKTNAGAIRLYERLGFARAGETDLYLSMRWQK